MKKLILKYLGKRFIVGETAKGAWPVWFDMKNLYGVNHVANILSSDILKSWAKYMELLIYGDISIKVPVGYALSQPLCNRAEMVGADICLDMEDSTAKDKTLWLYKDAVKNYPNNISIAIQAYLKSSWNDVFNICTDVPNPKIRLVKGAYFNLEKKRGTVYTSKARVEEEFLKLAQFIMLNGTLVCGTHNSKTIGMVMWLAEFNGLPKTAVEYQFIYGLSKDLWIDMAKRGYKVRVYTPIGDYITGAKYLLRRLDRSNIKFLIKEIL